MNLGGPVWHASASAPTQAEAWALAELALQGVGDATLGEWREVGERAVHLRRRLAATEQGAMRVRDIRGTAEEYQRRRVLLHDAPHLRAVLASAGLLP